MAYAPGDYRLESVPTPRAGADDIIIAVEACGICAGDSKAFDGAPSFWGDGKDQPAYIKAPMIPATSSSASPSSSARISPVAASSVSASG